MPQTMDNHLKRLKLSAVVPLILIFIMLMVELLRQTLPLDLTMLGVHPRHADGVVGILTHVFVHSSWRHLLVNSLPLFFLAWCLNYFYKDWSFVIFGVVWVMTGALTFAIGRDGWHVGASGIIYALFAFLFFSGLVNKTKPMVAASLLIVFLYGGMVWGITPYFVERNVSWEGHLAGFLSGMVAVLFFHSKSDYAKESERHYDDAEDEALYNKWVESLKPMPKVTGDDVKSDTAEPSGEQPDGEQRQDGGDATAARSSDGH